MKFLSIILFFCVTSAFAQTDSTFKENANIFPIWTFHDDSVNIQGVSIGIGTLAHSKRNTNTNGIKAELIGIGFFSIFGPRTLAATDSSEFEVAIKHPISERINGLNLSATGTYCECVTNGIAVGGIGQYNRQINGISASLMFNMTNIHNGLQLAFMNDSYIMNGIQVGGFGSHAEVLRGLQIGLVNRSEDLKGIQIGIWNINQDRSLPILNWSF